MHQATCRRGHAYAGRSCPTCRRDKRAAQRSDPPPVARGVPTAVEDGGWRKRAACRYEDGEAWFADKRARIAREYAIAVCSGCPVLDACRDYARRTRQPWGVWGGETPRQRGTAYVIRYSAL